MINFTVREGGFFASMSLRSMMKQLDHTGRRIDLLKIDCEECEWQSLPDIFDATHAKEMKIDQLQIELHRGEKERIHNLLESRRSRNANNAQGEKSLGLRSEFREVEWGCDRSGSARVGHTGGAAQSRQFIINNNVGKYQRVWGITTGARRAQRRSNGTTPEKRTADGSWR